MDARFLNVFEIGQYVMTKDTAEFTQFHAVPCREYIMRRDEGASEPKGWIQGNTKIVPVLEVAICCLHGKCGVEIRIMSMNKDNSHSWVRISHDLNTLVTNLFTNEPETSEVQFEEYALRLNASDFASRSKVKAKPQRRESSRSFFQKNFSYWGKNLDRCWNRRIFNLRLWSVEEIDPFSSSWKNTSRRRRIDWILENQGRSSDIFLVLLSLVWRKVEEQHGKRRRTKEKIPVLFWFIWNNFVPPSSSRPFTTQSHWSWFTRQCCYSEQFLPVHVSCRVCNQFSLHQEFRIDIGWRTKFEQQTDSILSACGTHGQKS